MSKFVLGTANFGMEYGIAGGGRIPPLCIAEIIDEAHKSRVFGIDTAMMYGDAESVLGDMNVSVFDVVTKLPPLPIGCYDIRSWAHDQIKSSLKRLKLEKVRAILLHNQHDAITASGMILINALDDIRRDYNLFNKIGVSIYHPDILDSIHEINTLDIIQAPLNILDRRILTSGWAEKLHNMGVELHIRSAFLQGLLLMPRDKIPTKFERWKDLWDAWHRTLDMTGVTPLEACLRFVANAPFVDKIVVGIENVSQLQEIVAVTDKPVMEFPEWELADDDLINPYKWVNL